MLLAVHAKRNRIGSQLWRATLRICQTIIRGLLTTGKATALHLWVPIGLLSLSFILRVLFALRFSASTDSASARGQAELAAELLRSLLGLHSSEEIESIGASRMFRADWQAARRSCSIVRRKMWTRPIGSNMCGMICFTAETEKLPGRA